MNIRELKDLINLMNENNLAEIEIEADGTKIKLRRNGGQVSVEPAVPTLPAPAPAAAKPATPAADAKVIKSPMVGTFYAAPAPDADPYVKTGAKVEIGQVVCIIEAMKLMNEIKSEVKGVVSEIHAANGEPVEFGQPLFSVT